MAGTYSSVFPPTTVAATTSIANGLTPYEHGWLGWDCYYPQIDKNVTVFLNQETGTDQPAADYNVAWTYCGYESIVSKIRKHGTDAFEVTPFTEPFPDSFDKICGQIKNLCRQPGKNIFMVTGMSLTVLCIRRAVMDQKQNRQFRYWKDKYKNYAGNCKIP